jgi:hypothetical protein
MVRVLLVLTLAIAAASGCGAAATPADPSSEFGTCATDLRAMPYQAGMSVLSSAGVFTVKLLDSTPGPPVKGQNTWTVEVDEVSTGAALDGLDVSVVPRMPDHPSHGTRPVVVTPSGSGIYVLKPVYLFMPGVWEVSLVIVGATVGSGTTDSAVIPVCIP